MKKLIIFIWIAAFVQAQAKPPNPVSFSPENNLELKCIFSNGNAPLYLRTEGGLTIHLSEPNRGGPKNWVYKIFGKPVYFGENLRLEVTPPTPENSEILHLEILGDPVDGAVDIFHSIDIHYPTLTVRSITVPNYVMPAVSDGSTCEVKILSNAPENCDEALHFHRHTLKSNALETSTAPELESK